MQILEGHSRWSSITFVSDKYSVTATRQRSGDIRISEHKTTLQRVQESKFTSIGALLIRLSSVPFLRGVTLFINTYIRNTVTFISFLIWLILTVFQGALPHSQLDRLFLSGSHYVLAIYIGVVALIVIGLRLTPISRYHAAEHMVFHCVESNHQLSEDNIKRSSRVLEQCGSNLGVFVFVILGILLALHVPMIWGLLISYSVGYELYIVSSDNPVYPVLRPCYWLAAVAQQIFLTAQPGERELQVAVAAVKRLRELHSAD